MRKVLLVGLVLGSVLLSGCNEKAEELRANPSVSEVGEFDGCQVTFVNRGYESNSFYMAKCPGTATTTTRNYTVQSGKTRTQKRSTVIAQEIETLQTQKAEAELHEKALEKLTPAEKQALGLK